MNGRSGLRPPCTYSQNSSSSDCCNIPHEAGHEETKNKGRFRPVGKLHRLFKQGRKGSGDLEYVGFNGASCVYLVQIPGERAGQDGGDDDD